MLLGLNYSSLFTEAVKWQEIGGSSHFNLPEKYIKTGSMGVNPNKGEEPSFKVTRRTVDHYSNYYSTFLKKKLS